MDLKLMLERTVRQHGRRTAIVMGDHRLSYAELDAQTHRIAGGLHRLGVKKGDRVAMALSNSPEFVATYFGIARAGAISIPVDTRYKPDEVSSIFDSCQPRFLVAEAPFLETLRPAMGRLESIEQVVGLGISGGDVLSYEEAFAAPIPGIDISLDPDDIATISYTSGPTTRPRGSTFTHRSLCAEAAISSDGFRQTERDILMLFALPLYHMFGLAAALLGSINKGSAIVMVPGTGISISSLMSAIEREKGTMLLGVPYIYALAVKMARREGVKNDLGSLRLCASGGAPLLVDTARQFKEHYGLSLLDIYGLTEAVSQVTCAPFGSNGKPGASGKALPGWGLRIVDDDDNELPPGRDGEIVVRGPSMCGYYNNPQDTARVIRNGWLHTGDIGRLDEDGYLYITGRKKRMIILKGQNVYPYDVEDVLRAHPGIADAEVTGAPDVLRGEIVTATIRLKPGVQISEQEIRQFCLERMADFKLPKQMTFVPSAAGENAAEKAPAKKV
ncbi:MAG: AMP-binding protein [Chloroflexi bacterium]|nr:AMP-binding protein [Chloroflexota bacterium]